MYHRKLVAFRDRFAKVPEREFNIAAVHCGSMHCVQGWAEKWGLSKDVTEFTCSYATRFARAFRLTAKQADYITSPNHYRPGARISTAIRHINDVLGGRK